MTQLETLIQTLCPNGVKRYKLKEIAEMQRGTSITKKDVVEGTIPVISGGKEPAYYCNTSNRDADVITVAGSGAGAGYVQYWEQPIFVCDSFSIKGKQDVSTKYLYYYLTNIQENIYATKKGGGVPHVHISSIENFQIPLPPLAVQSEIVRILDKFTLYKSELAAELAARLQQYEYYRDKLLTFDDTVKRVKLGEVAELKAGSFVSRTELKDCSTNGLPCYGGNGIRGYVNHYSHEGSFSIIGRQGALCGCVHYATGKFYATEHAVVVKTKESVLSKYLYYVLVHANLNQYKSQGAQPGLAVSNLNQLVFPIPSLEVQERIVSILDRFDKLCHDIREGLPAEIDLRQKQYEHYRDKLLTFEAKG